MTKPVEVKLKPCPLCASADVEIRESITDALVACNFCGARTGMVYLGANEASNAAKIRECVVAWNTRHEATRELVESANDVMAWHYRVEGKDPESHTALGRLHAALAKHTGGE
jgi:hypothetical protein